MKYVTRLNFIMSLGNSFYPNMGLIVVLVILLAEWFQGRVLKNDVFVSMLAMIYFVFFSVNNLTFIGLTNFQNFRAILKRLSSVFEMEEYRISRVTDGQGCRSIEAKNCSFSWGFRVKEDQANSKLNRVLIEEQEHPVIKDVNFKLVPGNLMVVIGSVGSGKTTLLHSILEETKVCSGTMEITGSIAYVEQEPFIISGSIKDNILMGKVYEEDLFHQALKASQLLNDISKF